VIALPTSIKRSQRNTGYLLGLRGDRVTYTFAIRAHTAVIHVWPIFLAVGIAISLVDTHSGQRCNEARVQDEGRMSCLGASAAESKPRPRDRSYRAACSRVVQADDYIRVGKLINRSQRIIA
jgi:hypothetical protein